MVMEILIDKVILRPSKMINLQLFRKWKGGRERKRKTEKNE